MATWLSVGAHTTVLAFMSEELFCPGFSLLLDLFHVFGRDRFRFAGKVRQHERLKSPMIDAWFIDGIRLSNSVYVTFLNGDILVSEVWLNRVAQIFDVMEVSHRVVIISARISFEFYAPQIQAVPLTEFARRVPEIALEANHWRQPHCAIDIFTFRGSLLADFVREIPPFLVGGMLWDLWLCEALNKKFDLVSTGRNPPIFHLEHIMTVKNESSPRVKENRRWFRTNLNYPIGTRNCNWSVRRGYIVQRFGPGRIKIPRYEPAYV
jgi:hypothetical protein